MLLVIFIICISKSLASYKPSNEEGKYIDLLPYEEKRDFLDNVAIRILTQVKTKNVPNKSSVEIPDSQLDKHTEFVNKILEEESKYLRLVTEKSKTGDGKNKKVLQDTLRSILSDKTYINDKKHKIDLTLRQGVRRKRDTSIDTKIAEAISKIPLKTVYENESTVTKNTNPLFHKRNQNHYKTETDIQVRGIKKLLGRPISNNVTQIPVTAVHSNEEKMYFNKVKITSMPLSEKIVDSTKNPNYDENQKSNDNSSTIGEYNNYNENTSKELIGITIDNNSTDDSVPNIVNTISNLETGTLTTVKNDVNSLKENNSNLLIDSYHVVNNSNMVKNEDRLTTKDGQYKDRNIQDSTMNPSDELTSSIILNVLNKSKISIGDFTPDTTTLFLDISKSKSNLERKEDIVKQFGNADKRVTNIMKLKAVPKLILQSNDSATVSAKRQAKFSNNENITKNNTFDGKDESSEEDNLKIAHNSIDALRNKVDIDEIKNKKVRKVSYDIKQSSGQKTNTYKVYEIRPGQVPFVKRKDKNKKQIIKDRYYDAPVYNYSPNNAYYYPYNKFEPHNESVKPSEKSLVMANVYSKDKTTFDNDLDKNYDVDGIQNSNEHDVEKFIETLQKFVRLRDKPFLLNNNLKDHVRSVKNVLKKQKYGDIVLSDIDIKTNIGSNKIDDVNVFLLTELLRKKLKRNSVFDGPNGISEDIFFGSGNTKNQITRGADKILQHIKDHIFQNKKHGGRLRKPKRNMVDYISILLATPHVIKNEDDVMVHTMLPILLTDTFYNKIRYSGNTGEIADDGFVLENLDYLLDPPKVDDEIADFVTVMQNLLGDKSEALQQYDWLETTVKIQSAIDKLQYMIDNLLNGRNLHPADLELLKYTIFLHTVAKHEMEKNYVTNRGQHIRERTKKPNNSPLPRNKRKPKRNFVKTKGLIDRIWLYRANTNFHGKHDLFYFQQFLDDLQNCLYDLHNALKSISMITSYNNQRWFRNLQDLYLNNVKMKQYLEIILHLSTVRLIDLIEESSKNGLEDNFVVYVKKNIEIVRRTIEEFVFVKRVLQEIKKI